MVLRNMFSLWYHYPLTLKIELRLDGWWARVVDVEMHLRGRDRGPFRTYLDAILIGNAEMDPEDRERTAYQCLECDAVLPIGTLCGCQPAEPLAEWERGWFWCSVCGDGFYRPHKKTVKGEPPQCCEATACRRRIAQDVYARANG